MLEFEFLARSSGYDTATLTIYSGNLQTESRMVNFWVKDDAEAAALAMESVGGLVESRGSSISRYDM